LHLQSHEVVVPLYKKRDPIRVIAPPPEHMHERLKACGWIEELKPAAMAATARPNQ
jgi:hypothetical protein